MPSSTIYPGSSISSRSSIHQSSSGRSQAPSVASSRRSSASYHSSSSRMSSGSAQTSASRSKEFMQVEKYGSLGSTVSRSSSHKSYDPTVHPASSSGRAHSEASNNRAMVPYAGSSSSSRAGSEVTVVRSSSYRAPSQISRSSSQRSPSVSGSRSGSQSGSTVIAPRSNSGSRNGSSRGREVAKRDAGRMERIEEEGPKTLKDASVSELLDEAEKKLGPRRPARYVCRCGIYACGCPHYY